MIVGGWTLTVRIEARAVNQGSTNWVLPFITFADETNCQLSSLASRDVSTLVILGSLRSGGERFPQPGTQTRVYHYSKSAPTLLQPNAHTSAVHIIWLPKKGTTVGKGFATGLGRERVIFNFALLGNCSGKWDSPSNNSIVLPAASLNWFLPDHYTALTGRFSFSFFKKGAHTHSHTHTHARSPHHQDTCWKLVTIHQEKVNGPPVCLSAEQARAGYCS